MVCQNVAFFMGDPVEIYRLDLIGPEEKLLANRIRVPFIFFRTTGSSRPLRALIN